MPGPSSRKLPPEAGYPGLPIDDGVPVLSKAFAFYSDVIQPRRAFNPDMVRATLNCNLQQIKHRCR